ncbi:3-deoxy-manno-octulosonate cytidylyltransferase [Photobacterium leiognathi]|uniref:3-deoxy-manno-octulosonate cytidylyltransferase n=1 Tax=Photobacterium leiognathi TaxID=553611 RepID=UPI001EDEEAEB|nr:3-deoxy-manno-octulosonate cytidylyltransferase [Photobacterium leiognathi]MCG3886776.1 3-deoxy-manno-octulosonate cytidylyltransferase [Photobacterium leiognathi]
MSMIKIVIPARYGSSRLEGKPLLEINGFPIFWHVYQRCLEANIECSDIIIATDDERIFRKASELDLPVVMTRNDHESGTDRINEVSQTLKWKEDTLVINVQGDEPLIPPSLISQVINFATDNSQYPITTAVTPINNLDDCNNPNVVKAILGLDGRALYFTRSASPFNRDNPTDISLSYRHIGIYTYRVNALSKFCSYPEAPLEKYEKLEQLRALSNGVVIGSCIYHGELPHGVDTYEDYQIIKNKMGC